MTAPNPQAAFLDLAARLARGDEILAAEQERVLRAAGLTVPDLEIAIHRAELLTLAHRGRFGSPQMGPMC